MLTAYCILVSKSADVLEICVASGMPGMGLQIKFEFVATPSTLKHTVSLGMRAQQLPAFVEGAPHAC